MSGADSKGGPIDLRVTPPDPARCVLCGAPNDCALARPDAGDAAEPCWCVGRVFPTALVDRATRRDGGRGCICRACLEAGHPEQTDEVDA